MFDRKQTDDLCPHDKQPCVKERCKGWQVGPTEKVIDGVKQTVLHGDCYLVWMLLIGKAIAHRTDGTQIAVESVRNEMVRNNFSLLKRLEKTDNLMLEDR